MADEPILKVTRESLSSGIIRKMAVERNDGDVQIASDDDLLVSRRTLVPDNADCEDIWIFGYGSLIFNP
ncbi:MAG: gamma-glutamylcyclotransferase, partial [Pseudomonadota bacterium]|nr:gamma-glutamylcyclotransferase [Pseudomonadota bacterium]